MHASGVRTQRKRTSEQHVNETFNGNALKHANNVLLWLRISAVSRESNSTAVLTLMCMYVVSCGLLIRRRQNCNRQNVRCSTILRYFSKSRSWRHFYSPRSKIVLSHTPTCGCFFLHNVSVVHWMFCFLFLEEGVREEELDTIEAQIGCKLPNDYRCSYRIHNGQKLVVPG